MHRLLSSKDARKYTPACRGLKAGILTVCMKLRPVSKSRFPNRYPCGSPDGFRTLFPAPSVNPDNRLKDLGTLPDGNFSFATAINQRGQIAGVSENDQIDPFSGNPEFHAVLWENDRIMDLGTLGGVSSFAETLNNRGQVTGVALNNVPDPYSILGLGSGTTLTLTQTRGFLWQHGEMQDLKTLGGPDTWAVFVNDRGQVARTSFTSYDVDPLTGTPPVGVFLWENGKMKDLGNLGGDNGLLPFYDIVNGLNNGGQVVGAMVVAGNQTTHAFLWDGRELADFGTLGGNLFLRQRDQRCRRVYWSRDASGRSDEPRVSMEKRGDDGCWYCGR